MTEYILDLSSKTQKNAANAKRKADYTDILFAIRREEKKLNRAHELLQKHRELKETMRDLDVNVPPS